MLANERRLPRWPLWLGCCVLASAQAQPWQVPEVVYPDIAARAEAPSGFVPPGWRVEHALRGRLDADGLDDVLLVLRMDDPGNVIRGEGAGGEPVDTNPRMLVAAVARAGGGWERVMADQALVPRRELPWMDDVFDDDAAGAVALGPERTWTVSLRSFSSAGSWGMRSVGYTFRLDDGCMRLLAHDDMHLHRASGEITTTHVDYLEGRAWTRTGSVGDDADGPKRWTRPASADPVCIETIGDGLRFEPELRDPAH